MSYCEKLPRRYAENKLRMMIDRWNGPAGEAVRSLGPKLWRGVPVTMLLAMSANSEGSTEAITSAGFWEIGLYNTPAGSPSASPPEPGSAYARIGSSRELTEALGREADLGRGRSGSWSTDIRGQVGIGLIDYRDGGRSLASSLPPSLRPASQHSPWAVALGILAYVEPSSARRVILSAQDEISGVDETQRFATLCAVIARRFEATGPVATEGYPLVRTMQRMFVGRKLAERLGEPTDWWPDFGPSLPAIEHWLTLAKYGQPTAACASSVVTAMGAAPPTTRTSALVELANAAVVAVAIVSVGYAVWRHMERDVPRFGA